MPESRQQYRSYIVVCLIALGIFTSVVGAAIWTLRQKSPRQQWNAMTEEEQTEFMRSVVKSQASHLPAMWQERIVANGISAMPMTLDRESTLRKAAEFAIAYDVAYLTQEERNKSGN